MSDTTIRDQIIEAAKQLIEDAVDSNNDRLFETVVRGSVRAKRALTLPACGIIEGEEEVEEILCPFVDKALPVEIEFRFKEERGTDPWQRYNYYLGKLQAILNATTNLGGLTRDVLEAGNSPDIDPAGGTSHLGSLLMEIRYRHRRVDPFTQV